MKIIGITGATGFVGRHVVKALLQRNVRIVAIARDKTKIQKFSWCDKVHIAEIDLHSANIRSEVQKLPPLDVLIHLAWSGLPHYQQLFHFEENLQKDCLFLRAILDKGLGHLMVTGTCLEYGMQNGCLHEQMPTAPQNPYALAKDSLRKYLQAIQKFQDFTLQWVRLFYLHGDGQNQNSLLSQLDRAIDDGAPVFNMSGGEQLRDYLPIETAAKILRVLVETPSYDGIINCCSGTPISVRNLVEQRVLDRQSAIKLNLGYFDYPDFEPMAFWGDDTKTRKIKEDLA